MPRLPKNKKISQKTRVLAIFGPQAPPGPISPWMRCAGAAAAGWCEAQFTLVFNAGGRASTEIMALPKGTIELKGLLKDMLQKKLDELGIPKANYKRKMRFAQAPQRIPHWEIGGK